MRIDYRSVFPAAVEAMATLEKAVRTSALEPELLELVKLRASSSTGVATASICTPRTPRRSASMPNGST